MIDIPLHHHCIPMGKEKPLAARTSKVSGPWPSDSPALSGKSTPQMGWIKWPIWCGLKKTTEPLKKHIPQSWDLHDGRLSIPLLPQSHYMLPQFAGYLSKYHQIYGDCFFPLLGILKITWKSGVKKTGHLPTNDLYIPCNNILVGE